MSAYRNEDGKVQFQSGDPLLDKWEAEHAQGFVPDLTEGLTSQMRAEMEASLARMGAERAASARLEAITAGGAPADASVATPSSWRQVHSVVKVSSGQ